MMRTLCALIVFLSLAVVVHAEDFVCQNVVRPECGGTTGLNASTYLRSRDPSTVNLGLCTAIAKAQTASTRTLIETVVAAHVNGRCHLKEASGVVVEMDAGEKDAVNTAIQAAQETQQALLDEANDPACRNVTLAQLTTAFTTLRTNLQGDLDGISSIATAKTELADAFTRVVNLLEKLAKCVRATR